MEFEYSICSICKRQFQKVHLFVDRKKCFHCWVADKDINNSLEQIDLYAHGTLLAVVIFLIKIRLGKERLDEFLGNLKKSKIKDQFIRKMYLEVRPELPKHNLRKRVKKTKLKKDRHIYKDECPYCHHPIYLNRVFSIPINCNYCGRYINRMGHPTESLLIEIKHNREGHRIRMRRSKMSLK